MFAHLTARSSLRDIASQLGAQARRLYHLGVKGAKRSTLSDANQDGPAEFFESVFHYLHSRGIKLHTLLDHDGHIPAPVQVTDAKTPDLVVARLLKLPSGSIMVFDRGYIDFSRFGDLDEQDQFFVTRMRRNISYNRNAVLTQVWIALITLLLLAFYKFKAKPGHTPTQILKLLNACTHDKLIGIFWLGAFSLKSLGIFSIIYKIVGIDKHVCCD